MSEYMTWLEVALTHLDHDIRLAGALEEYAVFGSTTLILRKIIDRPVGDIDVFVTRSAWGALLPMEGWHVETPNAGDPPILVKNTKVPLHLFFDWRDNFVEIDLRKVIREAEMVDGFRCATVKEVLRQKTAAFESGYPGTEKHAPDILKIKTYLEAE